MRSHLSFVRALLMTGACLLSLTTAATAATWTTNGGGNYTDAGNWSGGVPNAAGAVADFSTLDFSGDNSVTLNGLNPTVGAILFGDTDNAGSPTSWEIRTDDATLPIITLDNGGSTPSITVNPLGPTAGLFDDAYVGVPLNSATGLNKEGDGTLTIGAANTITGDVNINGGHLRFDTAGVPAGSNTYTMANGTTLSTSTGSNVIGGVSVNAGASVTINQRMTGTNYMNNISGQGSGESLVLNMAGDNNVNTIDGNWSGFDSVTFNGTAAGAAQLRIRPNGGGFNGASFANTALTINNASAFVRTNSFGNNIDIGSLAGDATAVIAGGNAGSAARYIIGSLDTSTEFAGTINGAGGLSINKIGAGTLTLSGGVSGTSPVLSGNTDPGRQGGVIRVTTGAIATSGTFDHFDGGGGTINSTIDVKAGATLDVSGSTNTFYSVAQQQFIGSGTIVGPFDHQAGYINPADVGVNDNDTDLTNILTPTVGTINFSGPLAFNGGSIVYDMGDTPGATPGSTDDLVVVAGNTDLGSGGVIVPNFLGSGPAAGLTYTVLQSDSFTGNTSGWSVAWPGRGTKPNVFTSGNLLQFTTTSVGSVGDVVWEGQVNGNWDIDSTGNWLLNGSQDTYFDGDNVTFNDDGNTATINVAQSVAPSSVVVDSNTNNYSFAGSSILTTGTLVKRGSSTLTLGMVNEFTGGVTVEGGTVDVGATGGALGTGPLELQANTTLTRQAFINNSGITINGAGVTINNNVADDVGMPSISGSGELTITSDQAATTISMGVTETFVGTINYAPQGANTMAIRAGGDASDYPNAVVNMTGTSYANRNGGSAAEATYSFGELHGDATSVLNGFSGGSTLFPDAIFEIGGLNTDSDFAGTIIDGGGSGGSTNQSHVLKIGTGKLSLTGFNTYTGDTTVDGGTLSLTNPYLADTADVFISAGAILELLFAGPDTIDSLYLDGTPQPVGTYGAIGSGATFESAYFNGTGLLNVSTLGDPLFTPGDFNMDGNVNGADFLAWQRGYPGTYDGADLADWEANYGAVAAASGSVGAVPEPTAGLLAVCAGLAGLLLRRRAG
ncbi:MAG: autotransporter-associated beta strand repeat-containing protein [Planctomycetales bacterium]|nr:autotransporter-associated beta strand repeat-containing protein [Planctomycetales bacterium]